MEILTEFDELQAALAKINMDESVFTYQNGKLIDSEAFNKSQKILNCPEMISAHKYIYELDMDQLTEEDTDKINQLYDLGVKRGFIIDDLTKWDDDGNEEEETVAVEEVPEAPAQPQNTLFKAKVPCWTVIYSATKDGSIKTGEAYSNAVSMSAAKADVNAKLSQCGYDNITILAIENCTDAPQPFAAAPTTEIDVNEADDEEKAEDEDTSDEETSDEGSDEEESGDEEVSDENANSDEESDEETSDDEESDEETSDDEESDEETSDDETSDEESDEETSDEETSDEEDSDEEELDAGKKSELRNMYRQTFKNTLVKCKFDTSFNDLTLEQKVKFFTELSKAWNEEYDPKDFMTDKELEQLDNVVADVDVGGDEESDEETSDEESDKESDEEESDEK